MEAYKQEAIEICRDLKYDNTVITKIKNASSECEVQQIMTSARHQQTIESNTKNFRVSDRRCNTYIRDICKLLVKYDGGITNTCEELARIFPNIQIPRRLVEKIKYKESNTDISNQYFKKDQFKN